MGIFILKVDANDPYPYPGAVNSSFILKWKKQLEIGDCDISILRDVERGYKEIVIAFKTIYINVYTIMVID